MNDKSPFREYWRVILLVVLLIGSTAIILSPGSQATPSNGSAVNQTIDSSDSSLNLKYGLELAGGTSVRAPLTGVSVSNVEVPRDERRNVSATIASELGIESYDVRIRYLSGGESSTATIEVYQDIDQDRLGTIVSRTSVDTTDMELQSDVSESTYDEAEDTLQARISQSGLSGGEVTQSISADNQRYIVVKLPNQNQQEVLDLIGERGLLRIDGVYPEDTGNETYEYREETIVTDADVHSVGQLENRDGGYGVPVTLTDSGAQKYVSFLEQNRYLTDQGVENCNVRSNGSDVSSRGFCLLSYQDDKFLHGAGISQGLADEMKRGTFQESPTVVMIASNRSEAQNLQITLRAGSMPTAVAIDQGTVRYLSPSQASEFKFYSLVIGLLTVLAVALTVGYRYRDVSIAAPMTVTAMSEVWLLLGFVAVVQLPLDLSHIAGLIAVVGTGVDDLIIIADEVMANGGAETKRVFESRFKKAFWVIGVAAVTTIVAMSPLAVLSLGDLQGFAIVTIVGVLIGVLVTRPAYGDVLKWLVERQDT